MVRERDGTRINYSLAGQDVLRLWLELRDASATRVAEVERAARNYLGDEVEAISRDELLKRLRRSHVVLVDVRPAEEFDAGHIEGALSIRSTARRSRRAAARRRDRRPARGAFCAYAHEAVRTLRAGGAPRNGSKAAGPNGSSRSKR